jgi:hypothetical protein
MLELFLVYHILGDFNKVTISGRINTSKIKIMYFVILKTTALIFINDFDNTNNKTMSRKIAPKTFSIK